jgi:hypothetical protein
VVILANENIWIGITNPSSTLYINGTTIHNGSVTTTANLLVANAALITATSLDFSNGGVNWYQASINLGAGGGIMEVTIIFILIVVRMVLHIVD